MIMPDDIADEKAKALEVLGATVVKVKPARIVDKKQVRCINASARDIS